MYAALWRLLPGPLWVRVVLAVISAAVVLWALTYFVFPWAADTLLPQSVTVEE
jgi:hypothetical protein